MRVEINVIPHSNQRYETIGDWQFKGDELQINVSDLGNIRYNVLVAIHEMIEAFECKFNGVTTEQVDAYDFSHPNAGNANLDSNLDAPYYEYHNDATAVEWLLSRLFGIDWKDYCKKIDKLGEQ